MTIERLVWLLLWAVIASSVAFSLMCLNALIEIGLMAYSS